MRVLEAADGLPIEPNHVYVTLSNATPMIQDGVFRLSRLVDPRGHRAAIDALLEYARRLPVEEDRANLVDERLLRDEISDFVSWSWT